jgi:hypothetical protein
MCFMNARRLTLTVLGALCAVVSMMALWSAPALAAAPEIPELSVEAHVPSPPSPSTEAVLHGVLNPNAIALSEAGSYEFLYKAGATCAGGTPAPIPPGLELGLEHEELPAETLTGLTANTEYTVCLREETTGGEAISPPVTFKTALPPETPETINPANPIAATTATLHGVLNPKAIGNPGTYEFLYKASATECEGGGTSGGSATGTMAEKVEAKLTGLLPSTTYAFCLRAHNEAGEESALAGPVTFTTLSAPPAIAGESASNVGSTEAKVAAQIDPEGLPVSYHVEYGTSEAYGQSTPEASLPAGQGAVGVEVWLSKLAPGTLYHYRFLATNAAHETTQDEEDKAFTTLPAPPPPGSEHCPNEQLRAEQGDLHLPDCRAYEQVTPSEKGATQDLTFESGEKAAVARSGERVALRSLVGFYGANPSSQGTNAVFSRTPSGWQMTSAQPPGAGQTFYEFNLANPELTLLGSDATTNTSLVSHSPEQSFPVGPVGGPYANVATTPYGGIFSEHRDALAGASGDFSHVVLSSQDHGLPSLSGPERAVAEGVVAGADDLYEWYAPTEELRLLNVTSAGALTSSCGAVLGGAEPGVERAPGSANAVSTDGSKIFFTSPDAESRSGEASCGEPQRIYIRVGGRETVDISAPEEHVSDPTGLHNAYYEGASEDGSKVWFTSETELTADDTTHAMERYEYNTVTGKLVRVSRGETGTAEGHVEREQLAISEDGSTVYFLALGKLTANALPGNGGVSNIYRYDTNTGTITLVAAAKIDNNGIIPLFTNRTGSALVFQAADGSPGSPDEIFRYSAADGSVKCVSCPPKGAVADSGAFFPSISVPLQFRNRVDRPRPISDNGRYVFFNSNYGLVPQDSNGIPNAGSNERRATDTYEWEADGAGSCTQVEGCVSLLSSGTSEFASAFLGASADGSNVFFATHAALAPQDGDALGDIYDARVDGGIPAPRPGAACAGESCRLIGGAAPVFGTPQSVAFYGAGNLPPAPVAKHKAVVKKKSKKKKRKKKARKGRKVGVRKANGRGR